MIRYCLNLALKNDLALIAAYDEYHKNVWPEIKESILSAGIQSMQIYRSGVQLFMIIETNADFSFEKKAIADRANPKVVEWEKLMETYQDVDSKSTRQKWVIMDPVFSLSGNIQIG